MNGGPWGSTPPKSMSQGRAFPAQCPGSTESTVLSWLGAYNSGDPTIEFWNWYLCGWCSVTYAIESLKAMGERVNRGKNHQQKQVPCSICYDLLGTKTLLWLFSFTKQIPEWNTVQVTPKATSGYTGAIIPSHCLGVHFWAISCSSFQRHWREFRMYFQISSTLQAWSMIIDYLLSY